MKKITFAERLKEARKNAKLSQETLAKKINRTKSTISRWESGERNPKMFEMVELEKALGISAETLMYGTEELKPSTLSEITRISSELEESRQQIILDTAKNQFNEQNTSNSHPNNNVNYKTLSVRGIEASKNGHWHDENIIIEIQIPTSLIPEQYDELVIILGDSMRPHLEHGELLFIQTGNKKSNFEIKEGQLGLFNTSKGKFIKKYHHNYLESLNSDFNHVFFKDDNQLKNIGIVVKTIKNNSYN